MGHTMSKTATPARRLAESVAPYLANDSRDAYTKLSISLPTELVALVRAAAEASGSSVSATIAAAVRKVLEDQAQERLDQALEAQNEESLALAKAYAPAAKHLLSKADW